MSYTTSLSDEGAARKNNSFSATASAGELERPFASGGFRWVAKGTYTEGQRDGETCVIKWFKDEAKQNIYEEDCFSDDIKATDKAIEIITKWNNSRVIDKKVCMNKCEVWTCSGDLSAKHKDGTKVLVEPYIDDFEKFNSNVGWTDGGGVSWSKVMQALSHFSYHITNGEYLLCDLQGSVYKNGIVLTDPVILSDEPGKFGNTDLGPKGISTFFNRHTCTKYCKATWSKPKSTASYFDLKEGTTMIPSANRSRQSGKGPMGVTTRFDRQTLPF